METLRVPAWLRWGLGVLLAAIVLLVWCGAQAPRAKGTDAAPTEFSGQRALAHSRRFATEPRPRGGHAAARGRDYIVRTLQGYGVEVEVMQEPVNHGTSVKFMENVMARIPGTGGNQTIGMTAHYDSVTWGPGAADDGAGVVVMLETARALKCGPPLKNDVVFVFTSDEEGGGNASVKSLEHPWLKDLNVMLGLEARGDWGTAYMFETSEGNLPLMRELARSGAPAISNSIMYEVHRRTPNTTDFTHMVHHGALGYNVAFVGGLQYYHTANDKPEHLSPDTLQHQGEYMLALVRHYGVDGPKIEKGEDAVFFNTLGKHLVVYPAHRERWFAGAAVVVFVLALGLGLYLRAVGPLAILGALCLMLSATALNAAIGAPLLWISYKLFYVYIMYNAFWYHLAFLCFGAAVALALLAWWRERLSPEALHAAVLLLWLGVLVALQYYLPIGGYVATWSLMFGAVGFGNACLLLKAGAPRGAVALVQLLAGLPAIAFTVPGWQALYHMGGALTPVVTSLIFLLNLFTLAPVVAVVVGAWGKRIAQAFAIVGVILFLCGWGAQRFSAEKPKMNSLSYAVNMDAKKAIWITTDERPDEWVSQFVPEDKASKGEYDDVLPGHHEGYAFAPAPVAALAASRMEVVSDSTAGAERNLVLRYTWTRSINETRIDLVSPTKVLRASVEGPGDVVADMSGWSLDVGYLPPSGEMLLHLTLEAANANPAKIQLVEESFTLPELTLMGYRPRPDWMIPKPNTLDWWEQNHFGSEHTFVTWSAEI